MFAPKPEIDVSHRKMVKLSKPVLIGDWGILPDRDPQTIEYEEAFRRQDVEEHERKILAWFIDRIGTHLYHCTLSVGNPDTDIKRSQLRIIDTLRSNLVGDLMAEFVKLGPK